MAKKPRGHKTESDTNTHCYAPHATHTGTNPNRAVAGKRHCYTTAPPREAKPTDPHPKDTKDDGKVWRTIRGRKIQLDQSKPLKDQIRDQLGSKYVHKREGTFRKKFELGDEVYFDDMKKSGTIRAILDRGVTIHEHGSWPLNPPEHFVHDSGVFKKSDTFDVDNVHWDIIPDSDRVHILKSLGTVGGEHYVNVAWNHLPEQIRDDILKYDSENIGASQWDGPATAMNAGTPNPLYEPSTINDLVVSARRGGNMNDNEKKE